MFRFNFGNPDSSNEKSSEKAVEPAQKIEPEFVPGLNPINETSVAISEDLKIFTLSRESLVKLLERDSDTEILEAEKSNSDLLPGIYEGGLKIWECTFDLGKFIYQNIKSSLENKTVLDLGCGVGVLGILARQLGASKVHFQDYNRGVLKNLTVPNVQLNFTSFENFEFWFGDWSGFRREQIYDVILTSETIYNVDNYSKLHQLFMNNLKPHGVIYLAAKSYYFGVGGSVTEFCDFIDKKNIFTWSKVFSIEEGVKRAILEIKYRNLL